MISGGGAEPETMSLISIHLTILARVQPLKSSAPIKAAMLCASNVALQSDARQSLQFRVRQGGEHLPIVSHDAQVVRQWSKGTPL